MVFLDRRLIVLLFLFIGLSYSKGTRKKEPVVNTSTGRVRGLVQKSLAGEKYLSFRGIPYAKPPVGPLRFEDPVPAQKWSGVRNAKDYGHVCPQIFLTNETRGNEDCLFVNIFTKGTTVPIKKRPVMVWIHGGGLTFCDGGNTLFGPDYLVRKDIVLVTFNYRLGVLGFLDLEDEIAPGNQGLKDQVQLLKWVKQNIANFGGDPDNVTIFGESSGGMSVHWIALSPLTKGLFHKVIIESGNIYNRAVKVKNPKNNAYKLVDILGRNIRDHKEIKKYLKTVDPRKLIEAQEKVATLEDGVTVEVSFGIGTDSQSKNPLMPVDFDKTALNGIQVPLLIGYNSHEVMGIFRIVKNNLDKWNDQFEKYFSQNFVRYFKEHYNLSLNDFKRFYFPKDGKITANNYKNMDTLFSDTYFVEGTCRTLRIQQEKSSHPTYFYVFTYDERLSANKKVILKLNETGAAHVDELEYIFRQKLYEDLGAPPLRKGKEGYRLMKQMTEMWSNFAIYGSPTPTVSRLIPNKWLPLDDNRSNLTYFNLGENLRTGRITSFLDRYSEFKK